MKRAASRGVTLIELLIAVSLLGLLSTAVVMSLGAGFTSLGKANAKVIANRRAISVQRILRSQVAGMMPGRLDCMTAANAPPVRTWLFDGRPETMRFVSSYSLEEAARGYPRILEYQVIAGENGRGVRLILNEILYTGPREAAPLCTGVLPSPVPGQFVAQFRPAEAGPRSFVLADKLAFCRFSYREAPPPPEAGYRWLPVWNHAGWPTAVRIEMAQLDPDPSRVPLLSLTAPVRMVRSLDLVYAD